MTNDILINIGGHGLGDCLLSLQISYYLKLNHVPHINLVSTRNEVFKPLDAVFGKEFKLIQIDEKYANDNALIKNDSILDEIKNTYNSSNITYNVPDLLFLNKLAFNYSKYNLSPQLIKKTRILIKSNINRDNIIYCGLCSSTEGYVYNNIPHLLLRLAEFLPNHQIYFPLINKWDKEINNLGNFDIFFPDNVFIDKNPSFSDSLKWLEKSCYGLFTCNGPSHIAYHLGIPRLVLDPQFYRIPWMARWKEDYEDCIPITTEYNEICRLVYHNITTPQTKMIDSKIILEMIKNNNDYNWARSLLFKNE